MKRLLKKILPSGMILAYHYFVALLGAIYYLFPSRKMIVIGVTGTKGKTSTINYIWSCLMSGGYQTGIISTANIRIGEKEYLNRYHMTMPGRFTLQRLMNQMVKVNCQFCLVEATSEGIKQYRHIGIDFDIAIFTNLTPEHLEAHGGSFEKYKQTKGKLFKSLKFSHPKIINGKKILKVIVSNKDDKYCDYFLNFPSDKKLTFSINTPSDYQVYDVKSVKEGSSFKVKNNSYELSIPGYFNVYNSLPAIVVSELFEIEQEKIAQGLKNLQIIPGRVERIENGQPFTVIVDYAHEKESLTNILKTAKQLKKAGSKIILLLGAEGGGRDKSKRPIMGEIAAKMADYIVISNVDPYDDDPKEIIEDIAKAAQDNGKVRQRDMFLIEDRKEGIRKALSLAKEGDVVLITGKGAEQSLVIGREKIPWDDRKVVKEQLEILLSLKK